MREDVTQLDNSEAFDVDGDESVFLNEQEREEFAKGKRLTVRLSATPNVAQTPEQKILGEEQTPRETTPLDLDDHAEPQDIKCYDALNRKIDAAQEAFAKQKAKSEEEHAAMLEAEARLNEAKKVAQVSGVRSQKAYALLAKRREEFHLKRDAAKAAYDRAKKRLETYNEEREMVKRDATQAKQAFASYTKFKTHMTEAQLETEPSAPTIAEFKHQTDQSLAAYHKFLNQMEQRRTRAESVRQEYNELSGEYHHLSDVANALTGVITNVTDIYKTAKLSLDEAQAKEAEEQALFVAHSTGYRTSLARSQQELQIEESSKEEKRRAKKRYWEMSAMEKKHLDLVTKWIAESELLTARHAKKTREAESLLGDIEESSAKIEDLKQKQESAATAAENFKAQFLNQGCGSVEDITPPPIEDEPEDEDWENASSSDTPRVIPDSDESPQGKEAMYERMYTKFLGDYKTGVAEAEQLAGQTKEALGDRGYSDCQYYTKLVSMYMDVSNQNLQYKDWLQASSDSNSPQDLKTSLLIEKDALLNDARAASFKKKMRSACGHDSEEGNLRTAKEEQARTGAESARKSAMSFLQLSATNQAAMMEAHLSKVKVASSVETKTKMTMKLTEFCDKQEALATTSLDAVQSADIAQQRYTAYLNMAREVQAQAQDAALHASNRRTAIQRKIVDSKFYASQAATAQLSPCDEA